METGELIGTTANKACSASTVQVMRQNGTLLTIGNNAGSLQPAVVRFGSKTRAMYSGDNLSITGGTNSGVVTIYGQLKSDGSLVIVAQDNSGNTLSIVPPGVLSPLPGPDAAEPKIPIYSWIISAGTFQFAGGTDLQPNQDCWIDSLFLTNYSGADATVTLTDNQSPVLNLLSAVTVAANSSVLLSFPGGIFANGGAKISASAQNSIQAKWRFARTRRGASLP